MSYILTVTLNPCIDRTVTFDGFHTGQLNRAVSERTDVGGKGINVSKVLKNMGCPTLATGIVFGEVGRSILARLDEIGIAHDFVISDNGNSRQNQKLLDYKTGEVTEVSGVGGEADNVLLKSFIDKYISLLKNATLVVLSGSVPRGVPSDIYTTLTLIAKESGIKVILDADGDLLKNGITAIPYMIKPNIFELERLIGEDSDEKQILDAIKILIDSGIGIVSVSMGKDGSLFADKDQLLKVSALKINGGCATGAGDSMVAAAAFGISNGFSLPMIARYASAAGSRTASKEGTEVCTMDEIVSGADEISLKNKHFL